MAMSVITDNVCDKGLLGKFYEAGLSGFKWQNGLLFSEYPFISAIVHVSALTQIEIFMHWNNWRFAQQKSL